MESAGAPPEVLVREKGTIAVAMSGGVDSSAAALLLCREGWKVIGLSMRLFDCGQDGMPGKNRLNATPLPAKTAVDVAKGDRLVIETPGGGGFGAAAPANLRKVK